MQLSQATRRISAAAGAVALSATLIQAQATTSEPATATAGTATLATGVSIDEAASTDSIDSRMDFVLNEIDRFERLERGRRIIKNNACHDDYGALTLTGSNRRKRAFLIRHIKLDKSWFGVRSNPAGRITKSSWEHRPCCHIGPSILFFNQTQRVGGVEITHLVGKKRGARLTKPTQCARPYSGLTPGRLYIRALINHLNAAWAKRNFRDDPPRQLKHWPKSCLP